MLRTKEISYSIGAKKILCNISVDFLPGKINMILGPNGSGKSTFLKIFSGEIKDFEGAVFLDDNNLHSIKPNDLAKKRAVMSQQPVLSFPLPVEEVVMMGRYPHFSFNPSKMDFDTCEEVMKLLQLTSFKKRNYLTLSGGEKQRVHFARMLAQVWETPTNSCRYIFLDEPLNNLDISFQQEILMILKAITKQNTLVVLVMHDLNLAMQYADELLFMKNGKLAASGAPGEIMSVSLIKEIFDVDVSIIQHPVNGTHCIFLENTRCVFL